MAEVTHDEKQVMADGILRIRCFPQNTMLSTLILLSNNTHIHVQKGYHPILVIDNCAILMRGTNYLYTILPYNKDDENWQQCTSDMISVMLRSVYCLLRDEVMIVKLTGGSTNTNLVGIWK